MDKNEYTAILYSPKQKSFHIESFDYTLRENRHRVLTDQEEPVYYLVEVISKLEDAVETVDWLRQVYIDNAQKEKTND